MRALITGVCGQDGSYLAEHLVARGDTVFGMVRGQPDVSRAWLSRLVPEVIQVEADLLDQSSLRKALLAAEPDVVYNLAAVTSVGMSWGQPMLTAQTNALGVLRLLESVRDVNPAIRVVHASSSDHFGDATECPQTVDTPVRPSNPYGVAKAMAHHLILSYRNNYGLSASTAIMYNHESPRRSPEYVVRKVTHAVAQIYEGRQKYLDMGNLHSYRDWGWAPEYITVYPLIAAHPEPDDFIVATGESHSVRELVETAFAHVGLDPKDHVRIRDHLRRPSDELRREGDPTRTRDVLGWQATIKFAGVVQLMMSHDLAAVGAA